mmetsp:Transcript_26597/g.88641  ORF Transcript_26597/g.88641 Transcript_26597/m.88641 type:complete len:218 (+) Transcript_26597:86-739(+)|eukprot:CAMPEP_0202763868 /NCGR_PEP_ID=MMETSP1388-20130828/24421_1 /ASSEMBLY_ACC=CAM_ASM_000864 /TAXON_ID=37098 /ORGANISM="Isochrysis sp, Strain CCMP1244" /LENGTH=217 /DNA_ID=CAMNT_0049432265 /DNA_START=18 /DNA_END=671 /DNA_ORIENTATION=-
MASDTPSSAAASASHALKLACLLAVPCAALSHYIGRPWRWFSLHPLLMSLAFVAAAGSGITVKRMGGRTNTLMHGYAMLSAFALALAGWYVIYQQKVMLGKPHNTSWHSLQGLLAIGGYALGAAAGLFALHPDFGQYRSSKGVRLAHKLASRAASLAALVAIGTGYFKLADAYSTPLLAAALVAFAVSCAFFEAPTKRPQPAPRLPETTPLQEVGSE